VNPVPANCARVTTGIGSPSNASRGWNCAGSGAFPPPWMAQRMTLRIPVPMKMRYETMPCCDGAHVDLDRTRAVGVVEGRTLVIGPPAIAPSV
jgi:hypothetical protein